MTIISDSRGGDSLEFGIVIMMVIIATLIKKIYVVIITVIVCCDIFVNVEHKMKKLLAIVQTITFILKSSFFFNGKRNDLCDSLK